MGAEGFAGPLFATKFLCLEKMGLVFPGDRFLDQFKTPPSALPYLPQSLLNKIWSHRDEENWRTVASRTMLITHFYQEMQNAGRIGK